MAALLDIPPLWARSAEQILQQQWRKVFILGAADCGKSTYCRFLVQRCLEAGRRVAVLDTDIGQKEIGPPATLTLGYPQAVQPLTQVPPAAWYFVGTTTPVGHLLPMTLGVRQLLEVARASCIIINTTGLVSGPGRILKSYKIEAVQPDIIVALEYGRELRSLLRAYRHYRIVYLPVSKAATSKSIGERRAVRERAFAAYFAAAPTVELAWRQVIFQRTLLFSGTRRPSQEFLYVEDTAEGRLVVAPRETVTTRGARVLPVGFERHLLCGLANRRNAGVGLGLIMHLDFVRETLTLRTPVPVAQIKLVQFGSLYVEPNGREPGGHVPRGLFV
ncbi:MAG: hypothetical protein FJZ47_06135 [Candidatus Tectomicrobia bacterium]|uniref:Clp1 P-loop domain-containing protein n=1 Tax=Tectimicrobiota bacterium TaxID=2528274 RepID=A0A938B053_UNCTE|nr:hypothetical protein [Candidatus Tectomicrobia bacterium]